MFKQQKVSLVAAALASLAMCGSVLAAQSDSTLTVSATLTSACAVSTTATIGFGSFSVLAPADQTANSASTFTVACSADMEPAIFATGTREMSDGVVSTLPFNLSLTAGAAADDLPSTLGAATPLTITQDGTAKVVALYARLVKADFTPLPAGTYTTSGVTVSVLY